MTSIAVLRVLMTSISPTGEKARCSRWPILICCGVTGDHRELTKNTKMPQLDAQASNFDHPALIRKLLARSIVLEGRGGGWSRGGLERRIKQVTTGLYNGWASSVRLN